MIGGIRCLSIFPVLFLAGCICLHGAPAFSVELKIHAAGPTAKGQTSMGRPGLLPDSRIGQGRRNIAAVWLAGPTNRYGHAVLGDDLEASRLVVETVGGNRFQLDLPETRVFEDLEPRLADVTGDGDDEIIVVETDAVQGAALAVYGIRGGGLARIAATPFLGQANRWLNPVGVGDFDGDGRPDIALVATPHIGGKLRLYRLEGAVLRRFAEFSGVSTHRIGSIELGLGRIVPAVPRDRLLVPDQAHRVLMLLEWTRGGWQERSRVALPGRLASSLVPVADARWQFRLENGQLLEIGLAP
jgi:FG-GAP-like repeat